MKLNHIFKPLAIIIGFGFLISCGVAPQQPNESGQTEIIPPPDSSTPTAKPLPNESKIETPAPKNISRINYGLTYQQPDGNRVIGGKGYLPNLSSVDIPLEGIPNWIVGVSFQGGILWTVALEEGSIASFLATEDGISEYPNPIASVPPGAPINSISTNVYHSLVTVPDPKQSPFTHPVYLPRSDSRAYISQNGDLNFINSADQLIATLQVNALLDARIIVDKQERLLLLTDPTQAYNHAVLGDSFEAKSYTIVDTYPTIQVSSQITLDDHEVIEGIAPIWIDITGDGIREIVVTVSDLDLGAGIVIFSESGERLAEGPKMGQPFRWRHQIAFAPSGPDGEQELIVVRTPHIGGVIEYYRYENGGFSVVAEYSGITSHSIGSRNLDMAAVGDFDGDGTIEVLLPNPGLTELVAIRRTQAGAEQAWALPIGGKLHTNLSGLSLPNGQLSFAVGRSDGILRIWMVK
jgi:hypothetical protein